MKLAIQIGLIVMALVVIPMLWVERVQPVGFNTQAMPAWSRKYNAECSLCHTTYPRLNRTGYEFKRLGYRFKWVPQRALQRGRQEHQRATATATRRIQSQHSRGRDRRQQIIRNYEGTSLTNCELRTMDNAVALVQTYLHVNGYFTVAEYPIIGSGRHGGYRTVTELDILAFRFPGATRLVPRLHGRGDDSAEREEPDPVLGTPADQADMLIGEVKDGRRTGIRDFWTMADRGLLPQETANYVPSVLAASRLLLGTDKTVIGGTRTSKDLGQHRESTFIGS